MRLRHRRPRQGLTLLEIAIVITIMAAVMVIALPNMLDVREQTALTNAAHLFARDLNRARVEAGRRNATICVTRDGTTGYRIDGLPTEMLPDGVSFAPGFASVCFRSFGPVSSGAGDYELELGADRKGIRIEPAGFAYVLQ
jgi:prepilin-type N-terminal cleavage/methylation domain-containing protein